MLAGERQLLALVGNLAEQARILDRQYRLARQGLHQLHGLGWKFAGSAALQHERTENALRTDERDDQHPTVPGGEVHVTQRSTRPLHEVGELDRRAACRRLAHRGLALQDAKFADRAQQRRVPPHRLGEAERAVRPAVTVDRPSIGTGQPDRAGQDRRQYRPEIEGRADRLPNFAQHLQFVDRTPELGGAGTQFVEQARVLDRDDRLIGKGRDQRDLLFGERLDIGPSEEEAANDGTLTEKRHRQHRTKLAKASRFEVGIFRIG